MAISLKPVHTLGAAGPEPQSEPEDALQVAQMRHLQGPILVIGADGFVGARLYSLLFGVRRDVYGTVADLRAWRLRLLQTGAKMFALDPVSGAGAEALIRKLNPRTIINCVEAPDAGLQAPKAQFDASYSFTRTILTYLESQDISCYSHVRPAWTTIRPDAEGEVKHPDESEYQIACDASTALVRHFGTVRHLPSVVVEIPPIYGPLQSPYHPLSQLYVDVTGSQAVFDDDSFHKWAQQATLLVGADFNYVDDICRAVVDSAAGAMEAGDGQTIDLSAHRQWQAITPPDAGLERLASWWRQIAEQGEQAGTTLFGVPGYRPDGKDSISAIVACYNEGPAIPIMHKRLRDVFEKLDIDYEIIFINNGSKDNSEELIRQISEEDPRVMGITHSRSFGAETSFKSGLEIASKRACVLMDGDLQDPPEMIEQFVEKWREGYDVVYGRRVKREAPLLMQFSYKAFYRLFAYFSYLQIPHDAGDFSLLDRNVVDAMLQFNERDLFLRGVRAYVGFKQTGIDYVRPERMFGKTSNNLLKNIGWAKKGILSFSRVPLEFLSYASVILVVLSILLGVLQILAKLIFPQSTAWGITTVLVVVLFFGAINMFAISLVGEYIAKIFDEVKERPHFIRRSVITCGEVKPAEEVFPGKLYG